VTEETDVADTAEATEPNGSMARYAAILRSPGFSAVLGTSVLGRLHESMISFGVIMLVTHQGSYAEAGVVMAAYGAGGIVAGPVASRLADRHGHVRVLLVTAVAFAGAVLVMAFSGGGLRTLAILGVVAGLCTPPLTPAVRSVLPRLVAPDRRLTAFALESTLQEVIFVAGPVLAGAVALAGGPRTALVVAAAATLLGTGGYCVALRTAGLAGAVGGRVDRGRRGSGGVTRRLARGSGGATGRLAGVGAPADPLLTPVVVRTLLGGVGFLALLSMAAVALIAQVSGETARGSAGLYLGLTSAGSMVGGLVFGARVRPDSPLRSRYVVLGGSLVVLAGVSALGDRAGVGPALALALALAAFGYGATISPVGAVLFGRLSEEAGEARATEAFGWMGAAMGVGGVVGDAVGGWSVTVAPPWAVMLAAAAVAGLTALAVPRRPSPGAPLPRLG
jgi:MFS family permease